MIEAVSLEQPDEPLVDLSDDRHLCPGCGTVYGPDGVTFYEGTLDYSLQSEVQTLSGHVYDMQQFFSELPTVLEKLFKGLETVSAVNGALLEEVQRLRRRLEKHEASHGTQQVAEEGTVDEGEKIDPSGEESSSG